MASNRARGDDGSIMKDQELYRRPLYPGLRFWWSERWVLSEINGEWWVRHEHFFPFATLGLKDYVSNVLESITADEFGLDQRKPWPARRKLDELRAAKALLEAIQTRG